MYSLVTVPYLSNVIDFACIDGVIACVTKINGEYWLQFYAFPSTSPMYSLSLSSNNVRLVVNDVRVEYTIITNRTDSTWLKLDSM